MYYMFKKKDYIWSVEKYINNCRNYTANTKRFIDISKNEFKKMFNVTLKKTIYRNNTYNKITGKNIVRFSLDSFWLKTMSRKYFLQN